MPPRLLVVADAPRPDVPGEVERFEQTRELFDSVDWDCEVSTNIPEGHLGITERIKSGLDWAFDQVGEAIILEDDCVPDPTFFAFCDELLDRHREDDEVMSVCGTNFLFHREDPADGYYLSRYFHSGAWATWGRAWRLYDPALSAWPEVREGGWLGEQVGEGNHAVTFWSHAFERAHRERDAWDAAWLFASWLHGALHAIPNVNLITNIGFRADGTHTRAEHRGAFNDVPSEPARLPLRHPPQLVRDTDADAFIESAIYSGTIEEVFQRIRAARHRGDRLEAR